MTSTSQATPSNTINSLLELLLAPEIIEPDKQCAQSPDYCEDLQSKEELKTIALSNNDDKVIYSHQ